MKIEVDYRLRNLSLFRFLVGLLIVGQFLGIFLDYDFYLSDAGWITRKQLAEMFHQNGFNLFFIVGDPAWIRYILLLVFAAAVCLSVGFYFRFMALFIFLAQSSLRYRMGWILYGGDEVLRAFTFLLLFFPAIGEPRRLRFVDTIGKLLRMQIIFIYFMAGFWKLHGLDWWNGEALQNLHAMGLLKGPEFVFNFLPNHYYFSKILNWLPMLGEISFGFFVSFEPTRRPCLLAAAFAHVLTLIYMRVDAFGLVMVCSYAIFFMKNDWDFFDRFKTSMARTGVNLCQGSKNLISRSILSD